MKNTRGAGGASTVTLADDHFRKLSQERLAAEMKGWGVAPPYQFKITVPFEIRADEVIREALYRRRRGRRLEPETGAVIRAEVGRLYKKHTDREHAASQLETSKGFWMHLRANERYAKYRLVVKDHKKTIEACLKLL